eukprot:Pgem_evm1s13443
MWSQVCTLRSLEIVNTFKKIGRESVVKNILETDIQKRVIGYDCDSAPGQSGSPIIKESTNTIIAIHRGKIAGEVDFSFGKPDYDNAGYKIAEASATVIDNDKYLWIQSIIEENRISDFGACCNTITSIIKNS